MATQLATFSKSLGIGHTQLATFSKSLGIGHTQLATFSKSLVTREHGYVVTVTRECGYT